MRIVKWQGNDGRGLAMRAEGGDGTMFLVPTHMAKRTAVASLRAIGEDPGDYDIHVLAPWVMSQWKRLGDDTRIINPNDRIPYLWRAFDARAEAGGVSTVRRSKGTLSLAETVGSRAVAWLPEEGSDADLALPLTSGDRELVGVAREYARMIRKDGLVDVGTAYKELPALLADAGVATRGIVLVGFDQMGYVQQTLVSGMDRHIGNVSFLVEARECDLMDAKRELRPDGTWDVESVPRPDGHGFHMTARVRHVLDDLATLGTVLDESPVCHGTPSHDGDGPIDDLVHALFVQDASDGIPCRSLVPPADGSVSLLHVAGVTAEDAATADLAREKAASGDVAIVGADAWRMWEGLAPYLLAPRKGASGDPLPSARVRATVSVPLSSIRTVSVMLDAARQIVTLSGMLSKDEREELGLAAAAESRHLLTAKAAAARHANEPTTAGWFMDMSRDVLGDMSWWPPDEILDLMSEEAIGAPVMTVTRLRSQWSRQRTLSPYAVLSTIMDPERVGEHMSGFARLVADGLMGKALASMRVRIRHMGPRDPGRGGASVMARATRALAASAMDILLSATKSVADPTPGEPESVERYFTCLGQVLAHSKVTGELSAAGAEADGDGAEELPSISLLSIEDADGIRPGSYGTVIMTGQDSVTSAVARDDSPQNVLMAKLGCAETAENMANYRASFMRAVSLAGSSIVFERVLRKAEGRHVSDTFPSVGLTNVLLAYAEGTEGDIPVWYASETAFASNLSPDGQVPHEVGKAHANPVEECSEGLLDLMWASRPRGGDDSHRVMLSASDVDTYAHCGYKWFIDRVLGIQSPVENLPAYAYGNFAHATMEGAHRDMIRNAARVVVDGDGHRYPVTPYALAMASGDRLSSKATGDDPGKASGPVPEGYDRGMPGTRIGGRGQVSPEEAEVAFRNKVRSMYVRELSGRGSSGPVPMIPHTITEATKADMTAQSVERFPAYESQMFWKEREDKSPSYFVPRFVELDFGEEYGRPVTIAGMPFHGTIDRIDVNSEKEAIILDYKNSSPDGFAQSHRLSPYEDSNLQLIVYAEAVRQILPDLKIVGLVYVGTRHPYAMSGKLDNAVFDATDAKGINLSADSRLLPKDQKARYNMPYDAPRTMEDFIDMMVGQVEEHVENMSRGIHTSPDAEGQGPRRQCSFCDARGRCLHS